MVKYENDSGKCRGRECRGRAFFQLHGISEMLLAEIQIVFKLRLNQLRVKIATKNKEYVNETETHAIIFKR